MKITKSILILFLVISLMSFTCYTPPVGAQVIPLSRLQQVEKILYGSSQELPIMERISRIEKTLYNQEQEGSLIERANNIINYVLPSVDKPSLLFLINTLDWTLTGEIGQEPVLVRVASIEKNLFGEERGGPLKDRIERLLKLSLPSEKLPVERINFPANKLIRIRLLDKLSSSYSKIGQEVEFEVVNDVKQNTKMVIPAGTEGILTIKNIEEAGKMGKDGSIELAFSRLIAIDGTEVPVKIDKKAQEENRSKQLALGASILGTVLLGPLGLIAGYFVEGKEEELPAGTELYVQTEKDIQLYGLVLH